MIASEKFKIINREGTSVEIFPPAGDSFYSKALIGVAAKNFTSPVSLESNKRSYFLPDTEVANGYIIKNMINGEYYLTVAVVPEIYSNRILSIAAHLFKCNATVNIKGFTETWDAYGNKTKATSSKVSEELCYIQSVSNELRQYDPGLHPDTRYVIYISQCSTTILDTVEITEYSPETKLKVVDVNNFIFEGISKIQVKAETRDA